MPSGEVETACQNARSASTRCFGASPGDDRRIDGADRDSGNPIGMQIGLGQRLINTRLIGAERAAALKQQRDLFKRSAALGHGKPSVPQCCAATSLQRLRHCSQVVAR